MRLAKLVDLRLFWVRVPGRPRLACFAEKCGIERNVTDGQGF